MYLNAAGRAKEATSHDRTESLATLGEVFHIRFERTGWCFPAWAKDVRALSFGAVWVVAHGNSVLRVFDPHWHRVDCLRGRGVLCWS